MQTGILIEPRYMDHEIGPYHPENPQRIEVILEMIERMISFPYQKITPRQAKKEELQWVHTQDYVTAVENTAGKDRVILDPDTSTSAFSYETALLAAGGILECLDCIQDGKIKNAFSPVRPPGHHAESSRAMGFCLFNNVAIGAEYLLKKHGMKKILIVDWDLHHGNGTQNSFYAREDVLYFSTHQYPHYPGTGHWSETGAEEGAGFNVNIPLSSGKTDGDYLYTFEEILAPVARAFEPDFILVSAGFDVSVSDPLGGMEVSSKGFGALTHQLMSLAEQLCEGKILIALEGGYDLHALQEGSRNVLLQLNGAAKPDIQAFPTERLEHELGPIVKNLKKYWKI